MDGEAHPGGGLGPAHRTYASLAEAAIRERVLDGRLAPGNRLNEVALAAELEISRGPLREAMQRLTIQGLLTSVSHRGSFVRSFTRDELEDLYELRIAIETFAVRAGAERATDDRIDEVRAVLAQTRAAMDGPTSGYPGELDFHRMLVSLADNAALIRAFDRAMQQVLVARARSSSDPARATTALQEHLDVLACVVARDGDGAAERLTEHLRGALQSALSVLDLG